MLVEIYNTCLYSWFQNYWYAIFGRLIFILRIIILPAPPHISILLLYLIIPFLWPGLIIKLHRFVRNILYFEVVLKVRNLTFHVFLHVSFYMNFHSSYREAIKMGERNLWPLINSSERPIKCDALTPRNNQQTLYFYLKNPTVL